MASLKQQALDQFEIVRRQRDTALKELSQAQEAITVLEAELKALKYHGDLALAKVADKLESSKRQIERAAPKVKHTGPTEWIGDWWLCNSETTTTLGPAEEAWKTDINNPQAAILLATEELRKNLVQKDRLRCRLFMAAIQLSVGDLESACTAATECIHDCGTDPRYRDHAGLAYYIRGRVFFDLKFYSKAHWDFSIAVLSTEYCDRAKVWRGHCETLIMEDEITDAAKDDSCPVSEDRP